ncbi:MAG: hypothetical protein OEW35_17370 [Gammaproteobacteria bacterium]|nr:hypothetical protein [Gammaproteobacteria bacterium]
MVVAVLPDRLNDVGAESRSLARVEVRLLDQRPRLVIGQPLYI